MQRCPSSDDESKAGLAAARRRGRKLRGWRWLLILALLLVGWGRGVSGEAAVGSGLEITRAARPWEFVSALGAESGLLGTESGNFEAWVYPLKLLRNFHLRFKVNDATLDARNLVRSVSVRPESTTLTYAWDTFTVRETLFAPLEEPGAVVELAVETSQPMEVEAVFERDFQLEWPGAMGGSDMDWNPALHAFAMGESQEKFTALVGSLTAREFHQEYATNYSSSTENSFGFGLLPKGKSIERIVMAASFQGRVPAEATYRRLSASYPKLLQEAAESYASYLAEHVHVRLPDEQLQAAYAWAQVSVRQGVVANPFLGRGLVAGYRPSGDDQRPGYAWFFGRDALWTTFALDAEGDYATAREALEFLSRYQRKDGKVPHEIAQGASFVPWFESMPFAYASADATPLYLIVMRDYVRCSGDLKFADAHWDNLWRAYQFMKTTYDANGFARNEGVGHGWVEGGPLLPVKNELYQAALATEALRALSELGAALHKDASGELDEQYTSGRTRLEQSYWMPEKGRYAFGLNSKDERVDAASVLAMVPMWFGLLDEKRSTQMMEQLASPEIQSDWGMRLIGTNDPRYEASGYHWGTVWPLFTGWAAVAEYRYHQALPAFENLRANALLTFDGSAGHVAEVLSGSYYQTLATGSPHQVWSSAMVITPLLTGLLGLGTDAEKQEIRMAPHLPAEWTYLDVENVRAGECEVDIHFEKSVGLMRYVLERKSGGRCVVTLSPALSLHTRVSKVEVDGRGVPFELRDNLTDRHVEVRVPLLKDKQTVVMRLKGDFGIDQQVSSPALGSVSHGLRVVSERWSAEADALTLKVASAVGGSFELGVWNPDAVRSVDGGVLVRESASQGKVSIEMPVTEGTGMVESAVVFHLKQAGIETKQKKVGTSSHVH